MSTTVRMRPLADVVGQALQWTQPSALQRDHELRMDGDLVATLRFEKGSLATAEAAVGSWTFKREGLWRPRVTVRRAGNDRNIAAFRPHMGGIGELTFNDNREFQLTSNPLGSEWIWKVGDQVLIRFSGPHGLIKANGTVEVKPDAAALTDLSLLVTLGWYLILLHLQEVAVTATSAVVAARVAAVR